MKLAEENARIKFVEIDMDEADDTMENKLKYVSWVPAFEIFKSGKLGERFYGDDVDVLKKKIAELKDVAESSKGELATSKSILESKNKEDATFGEVCIAKSVDVNTQNDEATRTKSKSDKGLTANKKETATKIGKKSTKKPSFFNRMFKCCSNA